METCESWGGWGGVLRKGTVSGSWGRRAAQPRWAVWGKLILGQDVAWACSRRWGASRRWPFDLTTNGLFSISKTGPALGSQSGKVARHRGLSAWFQGGGFADQLCAHEERSQVPGAVGMAGCQGLPDRPWAGCGALWCPDSPACFCRSWGRNECGVW